MIYSFDITRAILIKVQFQILPAEHNYDSYLKILTLKNMCLYPYPAHFKPTSLNASQTYVLQKLKIP